MEAKYDLNKTWVDAGHHKVVWQGQTTKSSEMICLRVQDWKIHLERKMVNWSSHWKWKEVKQSKVSRVKLSLCLTKHQAMKKC
jgi:hypothetical protein